MEKHQVAEVELTTTSLKVTTVSGAEFTAPQPGIDRFCRMAMDAMANNLPATFHTDGTNRIAGITVHRK